MGAGDGLHPHSRWGLEGPLTVLVLWSQAAPVCFPLGQGSLAGLWAGLAWEGKGLTQLRLLVAPLKGRGRFWRHQGPGAGHGGGSQEGQWNSDVVA